MPPQIHGDADQRMGVDGIPPESSLGVVTADWPGGVDRHTTDVELGSSSTVVAGQGDGEMGSVLRRIAAPVCSRRHEVQIGSLSCFG